MHALKTLLMLGLMSAVAISAAAGEQAAPAPAAATPPPATEQLTDITQIQLQVLISETTEEGLRNLGANLDYVRYVRGEEQSGSVERVVSRVFDPDTFTVTIPTPDNEAYPDNLRRTPDYEPRVSTPPTVGSGSITANSGIGTTFSIIDSNKGTIDGIFRAIEQKSDADLISRPELLVQIGKEAKIHAGEDIPYQALVYAKNKENLQVKWEEIGVNLTFTPTTPHEDMVLLSFSELKISARLPSSPIRGMDLPVFSTREQTGQIYVPNGHTLVIGGLATRNVFKTERRIPIVGKIPVVGSAFRSRRMEARNSHLLIFVSPTIVDLRDLKPQAISSLNFWREEKWKNLDRIDREIEMLEEGL